MDKEDRPDYSGKHKSILDELRKAQKAKGFLTKKDIVSIANEKQRPVADIYSIATFYHFIQTDRCSHTIYICNSMPCLLAGSEEIYKLISKEMSKEVNQPNDQVISLQTVGCIGQCDCAPAMMIDDHVYTNINEAKIKRLIRMLKPRSGKRQKG